MYIGTRQQHHEGYMDTSTKFLIVVFGVPLALSAFEQLMHRIAGGAHFWQQGENMPRELRRSTVLMNEEAISCTHPIPIQGRVDQVFLSQGGEVIPLDTKTRSAHRVMESDVVQLSVYAVALRQKYPTANVSHGYIRTVVGSVNDKSVVYHRVRLLSDRAVVRIAIG